MTPLRSRNPIPIGIIGLVALAVIMFALFNVNSLPVVGGGPVYQADFQEASSLNVGDDVRIAGVKVGKVSSVALVGDHVRVKAQLDSALPLGDRTSADIKLKTLLGQMFLSLRPDGTGRLRTSDVIPMERTTTPLIVTAAFQGLSSRIDKIDTAQLAQSFTTLADTFRNTPGQVRGTLDGLSRLSTTVASRDNQLQELLARAKDVTSVLANRTTEIRRLIDDSDQVLTLVSEQRTVIHNLLVDTSTLSQQLSALVAENSALLGPALDNLHAVTAILQRNQDSLDSGLHLLAPFVRDFSNTLGNGRWFDTYIVNLGNSAAFTTTTGGG